MTEYVRVCEIGIRLNAYTIKQRIGRYKTYTLVFLALMHQMTSLELISDIQESRLSFRSLFNDAINFQKL